MNKYKGLRIALGHQARVGKSTFTTRVTQVHGAKVLSFAKPVYEIAASIQKILGKPIRKDPALLQFIGEGLKRVYGDDIFVRPVIEECHEIFASDPDANILVDDLRHKIEKKQLEAIGFKCVKVTCSKRPIDRDPNHISEVDLSDAEFHYHLENESTIEDYINNVDLLVDVIAASN